MIMIAALDDQQEWLKQEEEITRKHFGDEGCKFTAYHNVDRFGKRNLVRYLSFGCRDAGYEWNWGGP